MSHIRWCVEKGCERERGNGHCGQSDVLEHVSYQMHERVSGVILDRRKRAKIYLHRLHAILGILLCTQPVTTHVLSWDNSVKKVGIKHTALVSHTLVLDNFADTDSITDADMSIIESYLVIVLSQNVLLTSLIDYVRITT